MNHGLRLVLNPAMHEFDLYRKKGLQKDPFSNTIKSIIVLEKDEQWIWFRLKNTA